MKITKLQPPSVYTYCNEYCICMYIHIYIYALMFQYVQVATHFAITILSTVGGDDWRA